MSQLQSSEQKPPPKPTTNINEFLNNTTTTKQLKQKDAPPKGYLPGAETYNEPPFKLAGICGCLLGTVFFSFGNLCVKMALDSSIHGKLKVLFFRGVFMILCSSIAITCRQGTFRVPKNELGINIMRALCGTSCILATYCSMSYISLGDSTALVFSSPVWTCILSRFILKEKISWFQVLAIPISFLGIILIAHPALLLSGLDPSTSLLEPSRQPIGLLVITREQVEQIRWPGIVFALAASVLMSCTLIVLKFRRETPVQTTTFWFGIAMILTSTIALPFLGPIEFPHRLRDWLLLICNGILSWLSQTVMQWTLTYESPNVVALCRTLDVAFGFVLSALFLQDIIHWTSILGSAITASVVTLLVLNKWLEHNFCYPKRIKSEYISVVLGK